MKQKQLRSISPEAAYPLLSLDNKEYAPPKLTPYCKIRALAKLFGLPLTQSRKDLTIAVGRKVFFDSGFVKPKSKELLKHYETEMFANLRVPEDQPEIETCPIPEVKETKLLSTIFNNELWNLQKTKVGSEELYKCLGEFTRPTMIFYNCSRAAPFLSNLTPIIYLPYVPDSIEHLSVPFVKSFTKYLGFFSQYEAGSKHDILKQKLKDLYYLVEDHSDLHLIVPCQAYLKTCNDIASEYCVNHMCKLCCQTSGYKIPCHVHSDQTSLFRYK